jgi:hypothetical protein
MEEFSVVIMKRFRSNWFKKTKMKHKNIKPTNKNPGVPNARQAKIRVLMLYLGPSHI